jgi:hypothetical protein
VEPILELPEAAQLGALRLLALAVLPRLPVEAREGYWRDLEKAVADIDAGLAPPVVH